MEKSSMDLKYRQSIPTLSSAARSVTVSIDANLPKGSE